MIIIDTNVLISALIKDSTTRKIIVQSGWKFCYPEIALNELREYKPLVLEKSGMSDLEYVQLLSLLLTKVRIIPQETLEHSLKEAIELFAHIDPDDVVFIAAALSLDAVIWSDDAHFGQQKKVLALKTKDMVRLFGGS